MKKFFNVIAAAGLLLSNFNLMYAITIDEFNSEWNRISHWDEYWEYFNWNNIVPCSPLNTRGCVIDMKKWTWSFENYWDLEVRKIVRPTTKIWEFEVDISVRGKEKIVDNSSNVKLCSVVVFDISKSMWSGWINVWKKWDNARDWAIDFSKKIIWFNEFSNIWLVFFWSTWEDILPLSRIEFSGWIFSDVTLSNTTNVHDWLIHAENMLLWVDWNACDNKYIVLMSDWQSQAYMSWWNYVASTFESWSLAAINEASFIKSNWIDIYTISYAMNIASWVDTLKSIATDSGHFFSWSTSNISSVYNDIFNDIYLDQISISYAKLDSVIDSLWEKIIWDEINISEEKNITSSWIVFSFPIRIDPIASWWVDTNNWLTLNYTDISWNQDSLVVSTGLSSKIYRQWPNCDWTLPEWNWIILWSWEYMQSWVKPTPPLRGQDDEYELYPSYYPRHYTWSSNPWICEWTCKSWYQLNQQLNRCEEVINTYTVEFNANDGTWTMINQNINSDEATHLNKNTFSKTGYTFAWWNTDEKGHWTWYADEAEVTNLTTAWESIILYAQWTANTYTIKFDKNGGNWTMGEQDMIYDAPANLNENTYTRNGYVFSWWNTKVDWSGTPYTDKAPVNNLATSWEITLYAQWTANTYTVIFSWNWATSWNMSNQAIVYGVLTSLNKNNYTKEWHSFLWWNTQSDWLWTWYWDQQSVSNLVTSGNITLYAKRWKNTYTVIFDSNWGNWLMPSQPIEYNTPTKLYKNTYEREWYAFSWWNTKSDWSWIPYIDEAEVTNLASTWSTKLYAQWTPNSYTIVFDGNWATSWTMGDQNIDYDDTDNLDKEQYQKEWYTFAWWNTEPDWSGTPYVDEAPVNNLATWGSITLYVQWTPNPYVIIFNGNWATTWTMDNQNMIYDNEDKLNKNVYKNDWYLFKWRNTKADWTWIPYADESTVKNLSTSGSVILYAQRWKNNTWWGSSWWGLKKDDCPDGDYSWDYYDKKCWSKVKTWKTETEPEEKPAVVTPVEHKTETKKCSIEWSKHSSEVNEAYIWACKNWIIKSQTIQGARLWEFLNRAEMAKIVSIFETLILDSKPNRNKDCSAFADSISWYNAEMKNYMITSCQLERMWIHTADHKPIKDFMPKKFVSRAEFWTILSRILRWNKYEAPKNSSKYYVEHLTSLKWEKIISNINPELKERRSYAILMIYRAAKKLGKA